LHHLSTLSHSGPLLAIFFFFFLLLSEGELIQMHWEGNPKIDPATYERIIHCKTACLFGAMTESAALIASRNPREIAEYKKFGEKLGRYFQVRDDYIDYFSSSGASGKKEMQDYERGLVTWPVIRMLEQRNGKVRKKIEKIWKDRSGLQSEMLELLADENVQKKSADYLKSELDSMLTFVEKHPPSSYRDTMSKTLSSLAL